MFSFVVMMTSVRDLVVPVIPLVGFSTSWFKLNVEIKSHNDLVSRLEASSL